MKNRNNTPDWTKPSWREPQINSNYFENILQLKRCSRCGKVNHFEKVCRSHSRQASRADKRCRAAHDMCHINENTESPTQDWYSKFKSFQIYSIRSVLIANLKNKSKHDTRSNFSLNRINFYFFTSFHQVTYTGFLKCEGKCSSQQQVGMCWKILFIKLFYYILFCCYYYNYWC